MSTIGSAISSGLGRILIGAAVGGVVIGGALGLLGVGGSAAEPGVMALDAVPVYACPGAGEVGTLFRGDRVLITGQSDGWLAVRNVRGSGDRVFVSAAFVTADADLSGLPVQDCEDVGILSVASSATVTTTTAPPGETTTTVAGSTTTSSSSTTSSTTTTTQAPTTTTTTQALPTVGGLSATPDPISEKFPLFPDTCPSNNGISTVSATVTAAAGVGTVTMSWSVGNLSGSSPMSLSGGQYRASVGPFDANDPPSVVPYQSSLPISVTVTVVDALGRDASAQTTVTLNDCAFG